VASFSSTGPTMDGRLKPDIVAPGDQIFSAASDGLTDTSNCGLLSLSGTSQAAAVVGGLAGIIRQYFREGWYPSGAMGGTPFYPSSALLKAMLINSGQAATGLTTTGSSNLPTKSEFKTLSGIPSFVQGWGRPQLDLILPIGVSASNFGFYVENSTVAEANVTNRVCIHVNSNSKPLKITVVWTDPPASPASGIMLINNIDLILAGIGGIEYRSNFGQELDSLNNVEQIIISEEEVQAGYYSILIHGTHLPMGSQPYALVVTGDFAISTSCTLDCPLRCGINNGQCINGLCSCNAGYYGPDCSLSWCPSDCNGNGVCTSEGSCECNLNWSGTDCSKLNPANNGNESGSSAFVSLATFVGISVAVFFGGIVLALPLGVCLALLVLRKKAIKKKRETMRLMMPPVLLPDTPSSSVMNFIPKTRSGIV